MMTNFTAFYILFLLGQYKESNREDKDKILTQINKMILDVDVNDLQIDTIQILVNAKTLNELSEDTLEVAIDNMMEDFKDGNNDDAKE